MSDALFSLLKIWRRLDDADEWKKRCRAHPLYRDEFPFEYDRHDLTPPLCSLSFCLHEAFGSAPSVAFVRQALDFPVRVGFQTLRQASIARSKTLHLGIFVIPRQVCEHVLDEGQRFNLAAETGANHYDLHGPYAQPLRMPLTSAAVRCRNLAVHFGVSSPTSRVMPSAFSYDGLCIALLHKRHRLDRKWET
ncbi:hypothetical protein BS17DRAFT_882388 [Gyrodon lividus]|nr:hypothetical protein BS17DRAFT_882388 [Gyrodon lividus]